MRILWHSVDPSAPTGYGQQTALWVPRIASLGHEVAISAFSGGTAGPRQWEGFPVYPCGAHPYGADILAEHARHFAADLVITLLDVWALGGWAMAGLPVACWVPVDCEPLSVRDRLALNRGRAIPIAMSRHGERMLAEAGFAPLYVPHGIDTAVFRPPEDRAALREQMGLGDRFVIGINATNMDGWRKGWPEQLAAFARLHRKHDDTVLIAHTLPKQKNGIDLIALARQLGIEKAIRWSDPYLMATGFITARQLAGTYGALDLYSGCAWAEGFGLPIVEAQSCGTPAVATDASAMREVCGGWLVRGEDAYIARHQANWRKPSIDAIAQVYEKAYQRGASYQAKRARAREHAMSFDADTVLTQFWKPALERLEARL